MTKSKPKISKVTNKADCGCSVGNYHESPEYYLTFCPLHASAEELLEHIKALHEHEGHRGMKCRPRICASAKLIAKAQGKESI